MAARPGQVVCLAAGRHPRLNLENIDKSGYVTLRGARGHRSVVEGVDLSGSSYLTIEGLRLTGYVGFNKQWRTDHLQFRFNDIGGFQDRLVAGAGAWNADASYGPVSDVLFERNYFHDATGGAGYAITIVGDGPNVTVRYNRFERIREDYLQSGNPTNWVVDHNIFGPGDFGRPAGYPGHPDLWQTLESGNGMRFTNNVTRDSNLSLGFIFGDMDTPDGFRDIEVRNNLFKRVVYGVGETCQFSPTNGFVFEQNTLVDTKGCRWGAGGTTDWPDGQNYSIKRNLLSGNSFLSCNNTSAANSCSAFKAGSAQNSSRWRKWVDTTWYVPVGRPANVGARLGPDEFQGFPFDAEAPPAIPVETSGDPPPGIRAKRVGAYVRTVVHQETNGRVRRLRMTCSGTGSPIVTCFLSWRIGRVGYRGDAFFRHSLRNGKLDWSYSVEGTGEKVGCRRCRAKRFSW